MNRFSFRIDYDAEARLEPCSEAAFADQHLRLSSENLHPALRLLSTGDRLLALLGNPIAEGKRDDEAVLRRFEKAGNPQDFLRDLNGSFLVVIYDPASGALTIGNDRFASLALYYAQEEGRLSAALSPKPLFDERQAQGRAKLEPEAVFEFLYFRRLLGERSFDRGIAYLTSAATLTVSPQDPGPKVEKYWSPDFSRKHAGGTALVRDLAEGLREATAMATSDGSRCGLLLSGGLDSRAILAAAANALPCVTTALRPNNEVAVAAEVAAAAGAAHHFVPRPPDLYDAVVDDAVFLTGGMQLYTEAHFLGYGAALRPIADTLLIGLGLDIFFGGLYLPKEPAQLFGRPALHHRLRPLSRDITGDFIAGVSYRLKTSDPFTLVKPPARARLEEHLRAAVEQIVERGRALGAADYDLWEYMHLHNLSRHYSFPMMASIRTFADCRAPALENRLFDLAIAMTAEQKRNGTAYQDAISRLSPAVMAVRNANTNVTAAHSLRRQTAIKALRMAANRLFGTPYPQSPGWQERSWPSPKAVLAANRSVLRRIEGLANSERLADLGFLDMDTLARLIEEHDAGRHDHAVCLNVLLTMERFLSPASRDSGAAAPPAEPLRTAL